MVGCPRCGASSGVQIVRDASRPWDHEAERTGARWLAHCDDCDATWVLTD